MKSLRPGQFLVGHLLSVESGARRSNRPALEEENVGIVVAAIVFQAFVDTQLGGSASLMPSVDIRGVVRNIFSTSKCNSCSFCSRREVRPASPLNLSIWVSGGEGYWFVHIPCIESNP